jgi:hypothetical protein
MRAPFLVLMASLLLVPLAADAWNKKGPWSMLVNAEGKKVHGDRDLLVGRAFGQPVGVYEVVVAPGDVRPIQNCVAVASSAEGAVGTIGIEVAGNGDWFRVYTTVGGGAALVDMPFYIVVHCPKFKKGD